MSLRATHPEVNLVFRTIRRASMFMPATYSVEVRRMPYRSGDRRDNPTEPLLAAARSEVIVRYSFWLQI